VNFSDSNSNNSFRNSNNSSFLVEVSADPVRRQNPNITAL
jgi:hypothetical protein